MNILQILEIFGLILMYGKCQMTHNMDIDEFWDILDIITEDIMQNHLPKGQTSLVIATDDISVLNKMQVIIRKHQTRYAPIGILLDTLTTEILDETGPDTNATILHAGIPWPHYYFNSVSTGNCVFFILIPLSTDNIDMLMEQISSQFRLSPQIDYFLFWPLDNNATNYMISNPKLSVLKYKLTQVLCEPDESYSLTSVCFYCDHGDPEIIEIGKIRIKNSLPKWNFISPFPDFTKSLKGKKIRVVYFFNYSREHIVKKKQDGEVITPTQMMAPFVPDALNFQWSWYRIDIGDSGAADTQMEDGTWTGFVGDVLYGKADYSFGTSLNYKAWHYVDYSFTFYTDYLMFVTRNPRPVFTALTLLQPFTLSMWILIGAAVLLCSCIFCVLLLNIKWKLGRIVLSQNIMSTSNNQPLFSYSIQYLSLSLIGWAPNCMPIAHSARLFLSFWLIFAIVINCAYQSKLIAFMTSPRMEILPDSFKELVESDFLYGGDAMQMVFVQMILENSDEPPIKYMLSNLVNYDSVRHCMETAVDESVACISIRLFIIHETNKFLDSNGEHILRVAKEMSTYIICGSVFPKNFVALGSFNRVYRVFVESGIIYHLIRKSEYMSLLVGLRDRDWSTSVNSGTKPLKLTELRGSFMGFGIGILVSLIAFIIEQSTKCSQFRFKEHVCLSTF